MKPRIGIIGTGRTVGIAHYHALGIMADGRAEIRAAYNAIDPENAVRFLAEHGLEKARVCQRYEELLEAVDAVIICTPNHTHVDYVLQAIEAGKAFLVEKPLGLSAEDSYRAVALLQGKSLWNMVGFVMRYAFVMQALRRLVQAEFGRIYTFQASYGGRRLANPAIPVEWRMQQRFSSTGALGDFGSHLVDLASFTAGMKLTAVQALVSIMIPERPANGDGLCRVENDDQAAFIARTASNALAAFTVSRVGMDDLKLVVVGEGGLARVDLANPGVIHHLPAQNGVYAAEPKTIRVPAQEPFAGWFVSQMQAFISGLLGQETEAADVFQGHYVETVLAAAHKACATPATPVEME